MDGREPNSRKKTAFSNVSPLFKKKKNNVIVLTKLMYSEKRQIV